MAWPLDAPGSMTAVYVVVVGVALCSDEWLGAGNTFCVVGEFCADERLRADGVVFAVANFRADSWVGLAAFGGGRYVVRAIRSATEE